MQYGNRVNADDIFRLLLRLNRTMQYGNDGIPSHFPSPYTRFKSYYVVWKQIVQTGIEKIIPSLNRTMQYGNNVLIYTKDEDYNV